MLVFGEMMVVSQVARMSAANDIVMNDVDDSDDDDNNDNVDNDNNDNNDDDCGGCCCPAALCSTSMADLLHAAAQHAFSLQRPC